MIYLDSAAMCRPLPCALEAYRSTPFGNPSSEHAAGQAARNALEQAREKIASLMDCEPGEVYFTSTATEAAALCSYSLAKDGGTAYIAGEYEHHAISENEDAFPVKNPDWPKVYAAQMLANNESGEVFLERPDFSPYQYGWICDATAAVGHIPVSFRELGCDYLLADAIKFGGVPGAAFLIAKRGVPLSPLIRGGGQERGMRSGTENVPAICAMAADLEWQMEHMEQTNERLTVTQGILVEELSKIPGHKWNTPLDKPHLPHILNVSFDGVDAHTLALLLSNDGVMVSPGAACSNGLHEPSHVIMAMFNDEARARSAIRISLSHENTEEECHAAAKKIAEAVEFLRRLN